MFETVSQSEILLPIELAPNGEKLWSYVHIQLNIPWFYVEVEHLEDGFTSYSMYILSTVAQLQRFNKNTNVRLTAVHISTPKYLNAGDCWRMFRVKRVLRARSKLQPKKLWTMVYEVYDEDRVIYDPPLLPKDSLEGMELLLVF